MGQAEGPLLAPSELATGSLCGLFLGCFAFGRRWLLDFLLLCLFGSECLLDLGQVVDFVFVENADVRAESQPQRQFGS